MGKHWLIKTMMGAIERYLWTDLVGTMAYCNVECMEIASSMNKWTKEKEKIDFFCACEIKRKGKDVITEWKCSIFYTGSGSLIIN